MDFHVISCDILDMITVDQIHICLIISPPAAKLKAYHRSITVNTQSAQVIYTVPVIGIKAGAVSHIKIHVSRCTRRNRKLIRGCIILLVLLWERTQIIIDRCLMLCQQRGITLQKVRLVTIGGIHIIILSVQLYNIPGMSLGTVCSITLHINTGDIQTLQQILHCSRIARTYRLFLPESSGYTLVIIRDHIFCIVYDISINSHYLRIIISTIRNLR